MSLVYSAAVMELPVSAPPESYSILTIVTGLEDQDTTGTVEGRGGANISITGLEDQDATGTVEGRGGADVAITGLEDRDYTGNVQVIPFSAAFWDLINSSDGAGQYLVEVTAIQGGLKLTSGGMGAAVMELPIMALPEAGGVNINEVTLTYADRFWVGSPSDANKPNAEYEDRVDLPLSMDRSLPIAPEEGTRIQRQAGFIELINTDGALDFIVNNYAIDGREVNVLYGPYMGAYADFQPVAKMLGVRMEHGAQNARLVVRDRAFPLSRALQNNFYEGTGGAEGTAELTGKPKPLLYGECYNVSATLIDPTNLIYQVHDGAIESILAVYDSGLALSLDTGVGTGGDVADYATLAAASVTASEYATCISEGLFKLGSSPAGQITADVEGDKTGGTYVSDLGDVCLRVIEDKASTATARINRDTFTTLPSYKVGKFISSDERATGAQVIDFLLGSINASWGPSRGGLIRAYRLSDPEAQVPAIVFGPEDIISMEPVRTITPRWRQEVGYKQNWTVQTGEGLAGAVSDARRQFLALLFRGAESEDVDIRTRHAEALSPALLASALIDQADAAAVAGEIMTLHGADRYEYAVTLKRKGWAVDLGEVAQFTYGRFGFEGGRNAIVRRISENASRNEIILTIWL